jgi:uncharacterized protein involved in outer membrane biogenesis
MLKKILIVGGIVIVVLFAGVFLWARSVLTGENVRAALGAQVEKAIGQPVTIGGLSASILPRVTVTLEDVAIGRPERITVGQLHVETDLRALLSRRIEHATMRLSGARIELPLPPLKIGGPSVEPAGGAEPERPPVELVSIDEIVLSDVQVVSGGRTLRGDIEVVPQGAGLVIRRITLAADRTTLTATGQITDVAGPVGELNVKAGALDLDQLLAFVSDFASGAGLSGAAPQTGGVATSTAPPSRRSLTLALDADSATMGALTLTRLTGKAKVDGTGLTLDPVSFAVFGGRYDGTLALVPGADTIRFRGQSQLSGIDMAEVVRFAGSPDTITGRLSGRMEFAGNGADPTAVMRSVNGRARVDIADGVVRRLGLVNSIVLATSMRSGSLDQAASAAKSGSSDEPFSKLGATLDIGNGAVTTNDLRFESRDVILDAQGVVQLVGSAVNLKGRVQLSDALSQQAGRDLVRYTQDQGRVTLPAAITGTIEAPRVSIDIGDLAKRAIQNAAAQQKQKATEEAKKAIQKKLGGLFGR